MNKTKINNLNIYPNLMKAGKGNKTAAMIARGLFIVR
jgi:hypothetical protein